MTEPVITQTYVADLPCCRGKVRDVYDLGETLVVVATDRISAFDWVMPTGIPGKGCLLTEMTAFWLNRLGIPHHLLSTDLADMPEPFRREPETFQGRTMLVKKTKVVPIECVARGYLAGSGWKEYQQDGTICGQALPPGLREAERLPEPLFTPATKAERGHDENIFFNAMATAIGCELAEVLRTRTLDVYCRAAEHTASRGIVLADTKLEWGMLPTGEILLIDEVLTPDSSRFWPAESYQPGSSPPSFDKQYLRDWLETTSWDKNSPPPLLPPEVVRRTAKRYREALHRLTDRVSVDSP